MNPTSENPSERGTDVDADLELDPETVEDLDTRDDGDVKGAVRGVQTESCIGTCGTRT